MNPQTGHAGHGGHAAADVITAVADIAVDSAAENNSPAENNSAAENNSPAENNSAAENNSPAENNSTGGNDDAEGTARDAARRPGRPRSERAEQAILDATIEAVSDCGIDGVRCEDVAARAGVGKATLYRRWPGKEDLLIAAFAALKSPLPEPRGESVREDLVAMLEVMVVDSDDPRYAQQYALLHGEGQRYPRLMARYKDLVVEPRRDLVRSVLRRGVATGELRPDTDIEVAMLALMGAVLARGGKRDASQARPGFATRVVDELLRGFAPHAQ